jgi:gamma-glutamyl-gamma-aminobutyrate hydrolase PuuD
MNRPLRIGVSARIQYGDASKPGYLKKNIYYIEHSYAQFILAHDAMPFLVPDLSGHRSTSLSLADYAAELDALMLQGGTDISPQAYGEQPLRPEWAGDPPRDRYETELLNRFIEAKKPVLGVCRGHQLLNVALGGTLFQDVGTDPGTQLQHSQPELRDQPTHKVKVTPGSRLAETLGTDELEVNSMHHQAVKALGAGLAAVAWAPDQVVEGVELVDPSRFVLGVQWHPEELCAHSEPARRLFAALVSAARS